MRHRLQKQPSPVRNGMHDARNTMREVRLVSDEVFDKLGPVIGIATAMAIVGVLILGIIVAMVDGPRSLCRDFGIGEVPCGQTVPATYGRGVHCFVRYPPARMSKEVICQSPEWENADRPTP